VLEGIKFTKQHEWVMMEEGELAVIGISDFAQEQLGDIVSIELPKVGTKFRQMQTIAIIDSVKASSDVFCPLSGEIVRVNDELSEHPEWINQSPYDLGWIIRLKPSNLEQVSGLMTGEEYNKFIGETEGKEKKDKEKRAEG
jgi:glycine cleavage system H protein